MTIKPTRSFWKVAGLFALLSIGPLSIYILYTRTGGVESRNEMAFQKNLRYALMANTDTVDLGPLTPWSWVTVCAFDSAVSAADMKAVMGFDYEHYNQLHWIGRADLWTLLFVDSEREVSWGKARPVVPVRVPRAELADAAFPDGAKGKCFPRDRAELPLERRSVPVGVSPVTVRLTE